MNARNPMLEALYAKPPRRPSITPRSVLLLRVGEDEPEEPMPTTPKPTGPTVRERILEALRKHGPMKSAQVIKRTGARTAGSTLVHMLKRGEITASRGQYNRTYSLPEAATVKESLTGQTEAPKPQPPETNSRTLHGFTVERGVPIPPFQGERTELLKAILAMEVGESILVDDKRFKHKVSYAREKFGRAYTTRSMPEGGTRIWRTA